MTTVRTRVLRGPTGSPATTGQVSIRSPHDQTAPDGTTIAKGLAATITLTGGAMPGTDLPPGNYEVQLRINNTTRAVNGTIWFPIVVPDTGTVYVEDAVDEFTQWTPPVVGAAQAARDLAVTKAAEAVEAAAEAAQAAQRLDQALAGAPSEYDTFLEIAQKFGANDTALGAVNSAIAARLTQSQVDARVTAVGNGAYAPVDEPVAKARVARKSFAAATSDASLTLSPGAFDQVDASGGSRTRKLAAGAVVDDQITVKVTAIATGNTVTIQGDTGVTASAITLTALNQAVTFSWTGSAWVVSGRDNPKTFLDINYAGMPPVFIDPRSFPDGPVTQLNRGTFSASFGNTPAVISGGVIQHSPVSGQTAAYIEAIAPGEIRRIGALVDFPATALGSVALVVPSGTWSTGITSAGVHAVLSSTGAVKQSGYDGAQNPSILLGRQNSVGDLRGGVHRFEAILDERNKSVQLYVDGILCVTQQEPSMFTMLSSYAIWELYESDAANMPPAKFLACWADNAVSRVPTAVPPASAYPLRPIAVSTTASASFSITTSATDIFTQALRTTMIVPPSGRILSTLSAVIQLSDATTVYAQPINGVAMVLAKNDSGVSRTNIATVTSVITGTPGQTVTVDWRVYKTGSNSAAALSGGSYGGAVATYEPLAA